jgi:hypothetical protein
MLYIVHQGNHPEVSYRGGQQAIVHLEADLNAAVAWANDDGRRWAFTLSNAGAYYTQFRSNLARLDDIDWEAVAANDWRAPDVKEGKQAEFLIHERFPWELIQGIGVRSPSVKAQVVAVLASAAQPLVEVRPDWYY